MVVCTRCGGKMFVGGVTPRKESREEMLAYYRESGKIHAVCVHCKRVSTLKKREEVSRGGEA